MWFGFDYAGKWMFFALFSYYSDCVTVGIEEVQSGGEMREVERDGRGLGGMHAYQCADYAVEAYGGAGRQACDG